MRKTWRSWTRTSARAQGRGDLNMEDKSKGNGEGDIEVKDKRKDEGNLKVKVNK